jgi:hypothetical protein
MPAAAATFETPVADRAALTSETLAFMAAENTGSWKAP